VQGSSLLGIRNRGFRDFRLEAVWQLVVQADNWGNLPAQVTWANNQDCWGITNSRATDVGAYIPVIACHRGWMESAAMAALSTPGTNDWTTKSGLGIAVGALTKAKLHWATPRRRPQFAMGCAEDIYFHKSAIGRRIGIPAGRGPADHSIPG